MYPSFEELRQYLRTHPRTTICELRDVYHQRGDDIIAYEKPKEEDQIVLAYGIQREFFTYLQSFIREQDVICQVDEMTCLVKDQTRYIGKGQFLPFVLSLAK